MTNFRKLTTAAFALTMGTVMSTGAFAMTCGEFNAMDEDAQKAAIMEMQGPDGGREEARDEARGEDSTEEGVGVEMSASGDTEVLDEAGQEGQHEMARGDDEMMAAVIEHCKGGDELMAEDVVHHPSEEEISE